MKIRLNQKASIEDVEDVFRQLQEYKNFHEAIDLLLPKRILNDTLGLGPTIILFVASWIRQGNFGRLYLDIGANPTEEEIEELYENEIIFPAVVLAWNTAEICNADGTENLRKYLKDINAVYYSKMERVEYLKGRKLILTSFDHLPNRKGILPCFEPNGKFIDSEEFLTFSIGPAIESTLDFSRETKRMFNQQRDYFNSIIYELMKNTFEWARTNINDAPLNPNIRGLLVKFVAKKRATFLEQYSNHEGLRKYFESGELKENATGQIYLMELSVFDSGIGFINRFKGANPDTTLPSIEILKRCMTKHSTTDKSMDRFDKGLGLDRILGILDGLGFIRIRTGNLSVYRNLISNKYSDVTEGKMTLFDWTLHGTQEQSKFPEFTGSMLTILYPLQIKE
jgi:hypothetical protein